MTRLMSQDVGKEFMLKQVFFCQPSNPIVKKIAVKPASFVSEESYTQNF